MSYQVRFWFVDHPDGAFSYVSMVGKRQKVKVVVRSVTTIYRSQFYVLFVRLNGACE